jgi:hypothetical protein
MHITSTVAKLIAVSSLYGKLVSVLNEATCHEYLKGCGVMAPRILSLGSRGRYLSTSGHGCFKLGEKDCEAHF